MPPTPIQNRKYLCQAPRNEIWEDIRDTVVAGMGDDPALVLETLLSKLRSIHPELKHPRSGPGRKSNAEHALFFYQYLLEYVKNLNGKFPVIHHPTPKISAMVPAAVATPSSNNFEHNPTSSPPICNVCQEDNPYDTTYIPCRTCPRIFHLGCLHPKHADGESYDEWICPYCVLNDASTPKILRHPAAAAVRVMARWRKQFARKRAQDPSLPVVHHVDMAALMRTEETKDAVGDLSKDAPEEKVQDPEDKGHAVAREIRRASHHERERNADEPEKKEQTEAEDKMDELGKPREAPVIESGPSSPDRSRRTRKQPTLYDPQSCAASRWASDELVERKISTKDDSTDDDKSDISQAPSKPQGDTRKSVRQIVLDSGEGFWCNFCRDDPELTLCVFCACRVCFSKHETDQLVCEECGQQYHAKCIGMPAPKGVTSWTCANCVEAKKHAKRVVPSRMRSRDTASKTTTAAVAATTSQRRSLRAPTPRRVEASPSPLSQQEQLKPVAKKRGNPGRRPVGRPPKNKGTVMAPPQQQPAPKKRGRSPSVGGPRKRGRPPKKPKEVPEVDQHELDGMEGDEKMHHSSTHVTRTGRTVKRSTFHDEIEEGAQLQKSSRKFPKTASSEQDEASLYLPDEDYVLPLSPVEQDAETAATLSVTSPSAAIMPPPPPPAPRQEHSSRTPRRKPGARECMQISRRFGDKVIPQNYYDILMDYCSRGKVEHLIRMRERLDEHSRFLELQLAGLESLVEQHGESDIVVPLMPEKQSDMP